MLTWHVKTSYNGKSLLGRLYSDCGRFRVDEDRRVNPDSVALTDMQTGIIYIVKHATAATTLADYIAKEG